MDKITSFRGKNSFLSNMYPVFVTFEGVRYPSVENAFQDVKIKSELAYYRDLKLIFIK